MKKSYMKVRPEKKNYLNTTWEAEANVDNGGFETTRYTHKVLREEVIDGKRYKVLSIWLDNDTTLWDNIGSEWERYSIDGVWIPCLESLFNGNDPAPTEETRWTCRVNNFYFINLKQDRKHIGEIWSTNDQIE